MPERTRLQRIKTFGFDEEIPYQFPIEKSSIANGKLDSEILLGDTGYGQGQMLMSPLHLAADYTAFVTDGNLVKPTLIKDGEKHRKSGISKWCRKPMPKKSQKG